MPQTSKKLNGQIGLRLFIYLSIYHIPLSPPPLGGGEGGARVSDFFLTKNPNLKKNFFGVGGGGARVSDFFY